MELHPEVIKFFSTAPLRKISPKAQAIADNIGGWPSHIPRPPLYRLAAALSGEKIPTAEKGFRPFTLRTVTKPGTNAEKFGMGTTIMVLPKFGESCQPAVNAEHILKNKHAKIAVVWDASTRPATEEEAAAFLAAAFAEERIDGEKR